MIDLPRFRPTAGQRAHIDHHRQTAAIVRRLWAEVSSRTRRDPRFISALVRATWVGSHEETDATRITRNRHWAEWWLAVDNASDETAIASALAKRLRGLSLAYARHVVRTHTGMTLYYAAVRPRTIAFLHRHIDQFSAAIALLVRSAPDPAAKVRKVAALLDELPEIRMPSGGTISCFSGFSPLLSCLDPQHRFPIMNQQTATLLRLLRVEQDANGAAALVAIQGQFNIRDSFDLDVYAYNYMDRIERVARRLRLKGHTAPRPRNASALGQKGEEAGVAQLARRRLQVRRLHNQLTNRFRNIVRWRHELKQTAIDILIEDWRDGRWLIIEAKTSTSGPAGRAQLRQAIGQLFDYRVMHFPKKPRAVDLALLTPTKPQDDVLELLRSLHIEALWFHGNALEGTIDLLR